MSSGTFTLAKLTFFVFFAGENILDSHIAQLASVSQQIGMFMDKLQRTGQNMGQVFNSIIDRLYALLLCCGKAKQTILKLKARPKQLLGNVPSKCCLSVCFCSLLHCPRKQSKSWGSCCLAAKRRQCKHIFIVSCQAENATVISQIVSAYEFCVFFFIEPAACTINILQWNSTI